MKKIIIYFTAISLVASCSVETTDVEKLEQKRAKLKLELAEIDAKLVSLDTSSNVIMASLISLQEAKITPFVHQLSVQGNIETEKDALINAESSGVIREILVKEGQQVRKGQLLVQIDASVIADNIQELNSSIEFAQYNYEKQKELFDKGVGSEFQLTQAKNSLDNLKKRLSGLQTQKGKFNVIAPFDGVIDEIYPKIGEMAGPQSPVVRLVNNREVKVSAEISERLYNRIHVGTPLMLTIPSLGDTTIQVTVTNIGNYIHPTNRTFRIQAEIHNNKLLLPNMLAQVRIEDYAKDSALVIPSASVLKDRNNQSYVFVAINENGKMKAERIDIQVVESFEGYSEIVGEINPGDKIVLKGAKGISQGDYLRVK